MVHGFFRLKVSRVRSNPVSVIVRVGPWRDGAFLELVMGFGFGGKFARI